MSEPIVADTWLYATLSGDATLTGIVTSVEQGIAPAGTAVPYVVFGYLGGADLMVVDRIRVWHNGVWVVKAVTTGSDWTAITEAADRIDELLHRQSGTPSGGVVLEAVREGVHRADYITDGVRHLELGGRYRILAQQS